MSLDSEQEPFEELFRRLEPEAESAAEGIQRCRHKLAKYFVWRRCPDADDLAGETISRLLKWAETQASADLHYGFVYGIAANVFREYSRRRKESGEVASIDDVLEIPDHSRSEIDDCQQHCLDQLAEDKRNLLVRYYVENIDCEDLARERGETINALRLKIYRIKDWLRRCCENCRNLSDKGN
jgi:RNA polymerase sigma factor (sigma-70 family)